MVADYPRRESKGGRGPRQAVGGATMQKIVTSLWFEDQAEDAANFYVSLFPNSRVVNVVRYGEAGPGEAGKVMVVDWVLDGQEFNGINGGPEFKFSEATSLIVNTESQ